VRSRQYYRAPLVHGQEASPNLESRGRAIPVTVVTSQLAPVGGEERAATELVSGLLARGQRVTVIAANCSLPTHPLMRVVRVPIPSRPASLRMALWMLLGSLVTWRRREGLLHAYGAIVLNHCDVLTIQFCYHAFRDHKQERRSSRSSPLYRINAWFVERLALVIERWAFRPSRTARLVTVSPGAAAEVRHYFPATCDAVEWIPNGVDLAAFRPDPDRRRRIRSRVGLTADDLVAVFVGGDWGRKGLLLAVEAIAQTSAWRLLVVGRGDIEEYRGIAERLGIGERVHFCGNVSDPAPYYSAADALLLPTSYETFSLATYEAAASGLPLLVTRVSGVEDLLVDGECGWFIDRDPAAIADRLERLTEDEGMRRTMGAAAERAVREYGWERVVDRYQRLYGEVAARSQLP
jgi:glycosyltransferase involved in cell wall biosynthesis